MKIFYKIALLITTLIVINGCTAADMEAFSRGFNQAYYGTNNSSSYNSGTVGFKTGERISGFNKICFYNKLGSVYTINIPNTSLCPLTIR
jgi:hypothetical protein|tara:strand:+ start:53 stop:322 length:270 start_codon:yes stop_codon:yes gene_type:complete